MSSSKALAEPARANPQPRLPFFPACPVCGEAKRATLVEFPELAFARCQTCGLIYKEQQLPGYGQGYEDAYFLSGNGKYMRRWAHRVRKCRRQIQSCLAF